MKDESKPLLVDDEDERGRANTRDDDLPQRDGHLTTTETHPPHASHGNQGTPMSNRYENARYDETPTPMNNSHLSPEYHHNQYGSHLNDHNPHVHSQFTSPYNNSLYSSRFPMQQNMLFRSDSPHHDQRNSHRKSSNNPMNRDRSKGVSRERRSYDRDTSRTHDGDSSRNRDESRSSRRDRERERERERSRGPRDTSMGAINPFDSTSQRRYSQSDLKYEKTKRPLFQRLISNHYTVTNPQSIEFGSSQAINNLLLPQHTGESLLSLDLEEQQRRLSVLNVLRPQKLIGKFKPLCIWYDYYNYDFLKIGRKSVRKYYEDQNFLIEKLTEIDNFLDAGKIHYNMLRNYDDQQTTILTTHVEETSDDDKNGHYHDENNHAIDDDDDDDDDDDNRNNKNANTNELNCPNDKIPGSKFSRFYIVPGNIDNDGAKLLGVDEEQENSDVVFAILVNFFINIVLLIGKIIVAMLTDSISVIASLVDSILDFLSTFIIYIANKLSTKRDWKIQHAYPVGRSRLEPLGILIFSIIIIISFFQVGQESFKRLFFPKEKSTANIGWDAIAIMAVTIVAKIGCWYWCKNSKSSSIQALAQDAETDIVFNTVSLLMPTLGHFFDIWWLDPLGAFSLSVYIIISWASTAYEHIDKLTGAVADSLDYKVILYLAYRFAEPIQHVTALKVYHFGDKSLVEIDIVFGITEFDLSFKDCHDIAEALQYAIETLPMVERAFVHIDYMEGNFKGHLK